MTIEPRPPGWIQAPLWQPKVTWEATPVSQMPSWTDARRVCLDVETRDDDLSDLGPGVRRGGYVVGVGFAIEDGPAHYLPIRHEGGGNLDQGQVWQYLRDQARQFGGELVFNGAPYDLDYLWHNEVLLTQRMRDVQVAEPLLDEHQHTYNLDAIAARRGLPGKDERELRDHAKAWGVDPKRGLWRLHAGCVGAYAIQDVRLPLQILRRQERELEEQELGTVYELESKLTPVLVKMTRRGLRVDLDEMDKVEAWATQRLKDYLDQIHHLTGVRVASINNANQLYPALKKRGLDVPIVNHAGTGKPTPSITKLWLAQQKDEVANAVVSGREFAKLLKTYVAGFRKHMVGDRIHPSYKQLRSASDEDENEDDGVAGGRCSAKHPNIQAQMKRSPEIRKKWRRVIVSDRGKRLYSADYSTQEPRLTVHYAELCRLPGARQAGDAFRENPRQDPYALMVELCGLGRDEVKELYLGRCYGMGGGKLARKLKLPTEWKTNTRTGFTYEAAGPEAQAILDRFDRGVPYVKALARRCTEAAKAKKYVVALFGRRCRFELNPDGSLKDEHKGLNKVIQNGAAGQTKAAAVALDDAGYPLQLTVHDEFGYSGDDDRQALGMAEIMRNVVKLSVPNRVDVSVGDNYGELSLLEPT